MTEYPKKVYLNGKILNHSEAKISVFDRGFLFGDSIYEVVAQINGKFFYGQKHFQRLDKSLKKVDITFDKSILESSIHKLLEASDLTGQDCILYIQVTRGIAPRAHSYPQNVAPTLMMYASRKTLPDINQTHASVITITDQRWLRCDIKTTSLIGNVMANDHATKQGYYEALFVRNGVITEASHCNVFFVKNNVIYTHPANEFILNGITRQIVFELCSDLHLEVREEAIEQNSISQMHEAFLTGTTVQIASVRQIDDHIFYDGQDSGEVVKMLQQAYLKIKDKQ